MFADGVDGPLFQAAHLGLRDAHLGGDLHLRLTLIKPQGQDAPFPGVQPLQGVFQGNALRPAFIGILGVADLVMTQMASPPLS